MNEHTPPTQTSGGCSRGGGAGWRRWRRASRNANLVSNLCHLRQSPAGISFYRFIYLSINIFGNVDLFLSIHLSIYISNRHFPPTQTSGGCSRGGGAGWKRWRRASRNANLVSGRCNSGAGIYVYIYICTYIYIYVDKHMYIYTHTSLNMYIYTYRSKHRPPTQTSGGCSRGGGVGWKRWRHAFRCVCV